MTARQVLGSLLTAALLAAVALCPFAAFTLLGGVGFAAPLGFSLAAVAVPLTLLYMLRARRPRRRVASIVLWRSVSRRQQSGTPFQRLRRNLVLLLQLLALAALTYGLARPVVQAGDQGGTSRVIVIDTSASMLARDQPRGGTRFEAARAKALSLVRSLGPGDEATVIAADRGARTVVPWTSDGATLERGLTRLEVRHTSTSLGEALLLAASARRAARGRVEVHLLSDGGGPSPPPVDLGGALVYHPYGSRVDNLGIVSIEARPGGHDEAGGGGREDDQTTPYEVFVSVRNAGPEPRVVFVLLERGGSGLAARKLELPGESDGAVVLEARLPPGPVSVRLLPPTEGGSLDPLPVDDVAWALIPEEQGVPVQLVTAAPSPAVERALEAAGASWREAPSGGGRDPDVRLYVFEGGRHDAPPRDCLFIAPAAAVGPVSLGETVPEVRVAAWDREDPLLRYVDLDGLRVEDATPLRVGGGARVLVQGEVASTGEPVVLMAAWEEGAARRVVIGFDVYRSSWPLQASFPIFVRNVLTLAGERDRLARGGIAAGVPLPIPVAGDATSVEVTDPAGRTARIDAWGGHAYFAATGRTGVYTASVGERVQQFCVNIGDPSESRIATLAGLDLAGEVSSAALESTRPLEVGRWFAMAALVLLVIEFWVYHRRLE